MHSYCPKISVFMLVNHKAAEANRLLFYTFFLSFFGVILNARHYGCPYKNNRPIEWNKSNIDFSSFESMHRINSFPLKYRNDYLYAIPKPHDCILKTHTLIASYPSMVTVLLLFSCVTSTYNHVGYLHLSSHS